METSDSVINTIHHEFVEDVNNDGESKQEKFMKHIELSMDTNERQRRYVETQKAKGGGIGIVFADAFIRGMRDIGYKNPGWALAEMIDNAIQASATTVEIRFGYDSENKTQSKPDMLAIIDNGAGMIPEMISYAVRWGGTDRENDRHGFGRYGYGLPSSAVSIALRYTVYSKTEGSDWHAVTVDLEQMAEANSDINKINELLLPHPAKLPKWLKGENGKLDLSNLSSGTVVVLENIDRLRRNSGWIRAKDLQAKLLQLFGVIYRYWVPERQIVVDGVAAEPVDPLFLMPNARYYDETSVRAQKVYDHAFEMESATGEKGVVRLRAALLPPNFQRVDPNDFSEKGAKLNKRHKIMREYNGLMICREGRQIDCIQPEWTKFQTYDFNVKIEIDFDPILDEYFGITTAKQQIVIDERMLEKLKQTGKESGGLQQLLKDMRAEYKRLVEKFSNLREKSEKSEEPRPSEVAMQEAEKFRVRRPTPSPKKVDEAKRNLDEAADMLAKKSGMPKEQATENLKAKIEKLAWEVDFDAIEEGPFYIPKRLGTQKRIVINTAHPFYQKVYDRAQEIKSALEVLLFVLADGEIDAEGEQEQFYKSARQHWSELLRHALGKLVDDEHVINRASAEIEETHVEGVKP